MKQLSRMALTLVVAVTLLFLADRMFEPVPIPAGTAVLGGLLMLWSRVKARGVWVGIGLAIGGMIGAAIHLYVHVSGQSTLPEEGVPAHVVADGIHGLAVGGVILLVASAVWAVPWRAREDWERQ